MKTLRILAAVVCVIIATLLIIMTIHAQMSNEYTWKQIVAVIFLDYGFMFIVWMFIDEYITNKYNKK